MVQINLKTHTHTHARTRARAHTHTRARARTRTHTHTQSHCENYVWLTASGLGKNKGSTVISLPSVELYSLKVLADNKNSKLNQGYSSNKRGKIALSPSS